MGGGIKEKYKPAGDPSLPEKMEAADVAAAIQEAHACECGKPHIPNRETRAAMAELERGGGKKFASTKELFADWESIENKQQPKGRKVMKKVGVSKSESMDSKLVNRHKRMAMGKKIELKKGGIVDSKEEEAKETKPKKKK